MRCPACGRRLHTVHVHGHGQCAFCTTPIEPCCAGAGDEADAQPWGPPAGLDAETMKKIFARLGGVRCTVTQEALMHALALRLGTWEQADRALQGLRKTGWLRSGGEGCYRLGRTGPRRRKSEPRKGSRT